MKAFSLIFFTVCLIVLYYRAQDVSVWVKKVRNDILRGNIPRVGKIGLKDENGFRRASKRGKNPMLNEKIALVCRNVQPLPQEFSFSPSEIDLLKRQHYDHGSVSFVTGLALGHLGLDPKRYTVKVTYDAFGTGGKAGTYSSNGFQKTINIILQNNLEVEQVLATVCHECTHAYLFDRNIRLEPEIENERLTDCAAIMLGFGKVIRTGYQQYMHSAGINTHVTSKVGYLDMGEIGYVISERDNILLQKELDAQKKDYIEGIRKGIEQLDEVISRHEYVVKQISENKSARPNEEDCRLLSGEIFNISSGLYRNRKAALEAQFGKAVKKSEFEEIKRESEKLGANLTMTAVKLGKYL